MAPQTHRLDIPNPLWRLLRICEVHCTARCCEENAFEQDPRLILSGLQNTNPDSIVQLKTANEQLSACISNIRAMRAADESDQILVYIPEERSGFYFQLSLDSAVEWFENWRAVIGEAARIHLAKG